MHRKICDGHHAVQRVNRGGYGINPKVRFRGDWLPRQGDEGVIDPEVIGLNSVGRDEGITQCELDLQGVLGTGSGIRDNRRSGVADGTGDIGVWGGPAEHAGLADLLFAWQKIDEIR